MAVVGERLRGQKEVKEDVAKVATNLAGGACRLGDTASSLPSATTASERACGRNEGRDRLSPPVHPRLRQSVRRLRRV